jgi:hypothetical protein
MTSLDIAACQLKWLVLPPAQQPRSAWRLAFPDFLNQLGRRQSASCPSDLAVGEHNRRKEHDREDRDRSADADVRQEAHDVLERWGVGAPAGKRNIMSTQVTATSTAITSSHMIQMAAILKRIQGVAG